MLDGKEQTDSRVSSDRNPPQGGGSAARRRAPRQRDTGHVRFRYAPVINHRPLGRRAGVHHRTNRRSAAAAAHGEWRRAIFRVAGRLDHQAMCARARFWTNGLSATWSPSMTTRRSCWWTQPSFRAVMTTG